MGRAMFPLEGPGKNGPYVFQLLGTAPVQAGSSLVLQPPLLLTGPLWSQRPARVFPQDELISKPPFPRISPHSLTYSQVSKEEDVDIFGGQANILPTCLAAKSCLTL